jgi:EmrB/QacA subfamily drug resistance transporter
MTQETSVPAEPSARGDRLDPAFRKLAVVLLLALLMALLDESIVNVGIRTLTARFDASLAAVQWVAAGYLLAVTIAIPFAGWSVDRFGGRAMWLVSVAVFVAGSLLAGLSWSIGSLIAFRVLQGFGGGMILPVVQSVLARAAGPARMAKAMSLMAIPLVVGPVVGPLAGGLVIDDISWRWMFFINVPIGIIALLLAWRQLPADEDGAGDAPLDVLGLLLLSPGFAAVVYGLTAAGQHGDFSVPQATVAFAVGVVLLLAYGVHALRTRAPLIDLRLFGRRGFTMAVVTMLLVGAVANGLLLLTPLYYQQGRGFGALHAGLLLTPSGLLGAVGSTLIGRVAGRYTARLTAPVGMALSAIGMAAFTQAGADTNQAWLALMVGVGGFGVGFTIPGTLAFMYNAVGPQSAARATSALFIFNQIGGALGIAVLAVTLQRRLHGAAHSFAAFNLVYGLVVAFAVVALLAAAFLPGSLRAAPPPEPEQA